MKIRFLGNWSSNLKKGKRNVSFVVEDAFIFDFGPHSLESLLEYGIEISKINTIFISHLHLDHYSGIPELLWHKANNGIRSKLTIVGPKGIKENVYIMLKALNTPAPWYELINSTVNFIEDKDTEEAKIFKGRHIIQDNGYRFTYMGRTLFYSGDTTYSEKIVEGAKDVDVLIHEMTYTDEDEKTAKYWKHSTYKDVIRVFEESGAKMLIPVHLSTKTDRLTLKLSKENKQIKYPYTDREIIL
ncbi:MAG: MBL fold metallo-hydrolase [Nitrososphaeria archaeon]